MTNKIDHEYTDEIVCPYCGESDNESYEYADPDCGETECGFCERSFNYSVHISIEYSTETDCSTEGKFHVWLGPYRVFEYEDRAGVWCYIRKCLNCQQEDYFWQEAILEML